MSEPPTTMRVRRRADHRDPHPAAAPPDRRAAIILSLVSIGGMLAWIGLSFLRIGAATPPGAAWLINSWSSLSSWSWSSLPVTSPRATVAASGPAQAHPLQCGSSGLSSIGSALTIRPEEVVCGDVLVIGGDADVEGEIRGSLQVIGGNTTVAGIVTGDISDVGGDITVQGGGRVDGATHAIGGSVLIAPDAIVRDVGTDIQGPRDLTRPPGLSFSIDVGAFWLSLLFWLSATLGITLFAPEMVGQVRYTVSRHFLLSGTIGALSAIVAGVIAVALVFTCIGIPIALLIAVTAWAGWVVGAVGVGAWLGSLLFGGPGKSRQPSLMASALLGSTILCVIKALPVLGEIVGVVVGAVALGAAILTLLSARRAPALRRAF